MKSNERLLKVAKQALSVLDYVCFESEKMNQDDNVRRVIHELQRTIKAVEGEII